MRLTILGLCAAVLLLMACDESTEDPTYDLCARPGDVPPLCNERISLHIEFDRGAGVYFDRTMPGLVGHELEDSLSSWLSRGCTEIACTTFDDFLFDDIISAQDVEIYANKTLDFNRQHYYGDPDTVNYELHVLIILDLWENSDYPDDARLGLGKANTAWKGGFAYLFLNVFDMEMYGLGLSGDERRAPLISNRLLHEIGHHMWQPDLASVEDLGDRHSEDERCVMGMTVGMVDGEIEYINPGNAGTPVLEITRFCCACYNDLEYRLWQW